MPSNNDNVIFRGHWLTSVAFLPALCRIKGETLLCFGQSQQWLAKSHDRRGRVVSIPGRLTHLQHIDITWKTWLIGKSTDNGERSPTPHLEPF